MEEAIQYQSLVSTGTCMGIPTQTHGCAYIYQTHIENESIKRPKIYVGPVEYAHKTDNSVLKYIKLWYATVT